MIDEDAETQAKPFVSKVKRARQVGKARTQGSPGKLAVDGSCPAESGARSPCSELLEVCDFPPPLPFPPSQGTSDFCAAPDTFILNITEGQVRR